MFEKKYFELFLVSLYIFKIFKLCEVNNFYTYKMVDEAVVQSKGITHF